MNPSFSRNLIQFRLRKGWSLDELARRTAGQLTKQALSKYEKVRAFPTAKSLLTLCRALEVSPSDLLAEREIHLQFLGYRKASRLSKTEQARIESEVTWQAQNRLKLANAVGAAVSRWNLQTRTISEMVEAEEIAHDVRDEWRLGRGPLQGFMEICEQNGVEVFEIAVSDQFSGLSARTNEGKVVVVIQKRERDGARQRMDLAHELGHLLLDENSKVETEPFVRRFAGAFLLPRDTVRGELGEKRSGFTWDELKTLKMRYGVSMQAWVRRALDLGIISEALYRQISIAFSTTHKRKDEGEPRVTPEKNERPTRLASRAVTEGIMSPAEAAKLAGVQEIQLKDLVPSSLKKVETSIPIRRMTREERRKAAQIAVEKSADFYAAHPEEVLPDVVE